MKIFLTVLTFFILSVSPSFGADSGSCTEVSPRGFSNLSATAADPARYRLTLLCTTDATGALSSTLSDTVMTKITGKYLNSLKSYPGSEAPTDNTDLEITDSDGLILLSANGTDFIDATTAKKTAPFNSFLSINDRILAARDEAWVISATGNVVATATFYLKFYLTD